MSVVLFGYSGFFHHENWSPWYSWMIAERGIKHNKSKSTNQSNVKTGTRLFIKKKNSHINSNFFRKTYVQFLFPNPWRNRNYLTAHQVTCLLGKLFVDHSPTKPFRFPHTNDGICVCVCLVVSNTSCVVSLFWFSLSCVPYIASFSGWSIFNWPFRFF